MKRGISSGMMLTLLLIGMLPLIFVVQSVKAEELWKSPIIDNIPFNADVGDVDGDGINDVAIIPCAWHENGTPSNLQIFRSDGTTLWTKTVLVDGNGIALEDVDLDGKSEVFVFGRTQAGNYSGIIYAIDDNGTNLWSFNPGDNYWSILNVASFVNLDADSELEIVVVEIGWSRYWTYALDTNGTLLWKFRADFYLSDLAIGDVTGDGNEEILLFTFRDICVLDKQGNIIWRQTIHNGTYGALGSLGDVTGNGINDVVVGVAAYDSSSFHNTLYIFSNNGTLLWQKEYQQDEHGRIQNLLVLDVNNDNVKDVIVSANRTIFAYRNDGELLWAYGNGSYNIPIEHFDVNRDGNEEIVFADGVLTSIGIGHGPAYVGPYIYALSFEGEKVMTFVLPDDGKWIIPGYSHTRDVRRYYLFGDLNNNSYDELIIQRVLDGQYYLAILTPSQAPPPSPEPVGGKAAPIVIPVNQSELLTPYRGLTLLLAVAFATVVYAKKRKPRHQ